MNKDQEIKEITEKINKINNEIENKNNINELTLAILDFIINNKNKLVKNKYIIFIDKSKMKLLTEKSKVKIAQSLTSQLTDLNVEYLEELGANPMEQEGGRSESFYIEFKKGK